MLQLSDREWAEFKIGELLTLKVAKSNDKGKLEVGTVPFVGRSNDNNGLQGFYDAPNVTRGKCITLGMVGTFRAFWQENDFAASQNILTLRAPWLNRNTALFICNIIEIAIKGRYSYGNSIKAGTFWDTILNLPVDDNGQPDYDFMEQYIAEREPDYSWATQCIEPNAELSLTDREWAEFQIGSLFTVEQGKGKIDRDRLNGDHTGFKIATASTTDNGIIWSKDEQNAKKRSGNTITIGRQTGVAFYQQDEYFETDNILILTNSKINQLSGLFIAGAYNNSTASKFSYGRVASIGKIKVEYIKLPITKDGLPDYDFMAQYIKSLPFSKVLEAITL